MSRSYANAVPARYDAPIEALRRSTRPDRPAPAAMQPYLAKVRDGAYRVVDSDIEELGELGFTEDEIFEQTVSVAAASGLTRLEAALRVAR